MTQNVMIRYLKPGWNNSINTIHKENIREKKIVPHLGNNMCCGTDYEKKKKKTYTTMSITDTEKKLGMKWNEW